MSDVFRIIANVIIYGCGLFGVCSLVSIKDEIKEVIKFLVKGD